MTTRIHISDLLARHGAISYDARHDLDGWKVRLYFQGGTTQDITLATNAKLILDQ